MYILFGVRSPENFFPCEICTVLKTEESRSGKVNTSSFTVEGKLF